MALYFRKSMKFGPVRVTASKRGLGYSVGAGPVRLTRGATGRVTRTVRVPGTGIYDRTTLSSGKRTASSSRRRATSSRTPAAESATQPPSRMTMAALALVVFVVGLVVALLGSVVAIVIGVVVMLFGLFLSLGIFAPSGDGQNHSAPTPSAPPVSAIPPAQQHPSLPAGWYPDQVQAGRERYWDGGTWTSATRWPPQL